MKADLVAYLDVGGDAGDVVDFLVAGVLDLETGRPGEDAAFYRVVGFVNFNKDNCADGDDADDRDGNSDNFAFAGANALVAGVAGLGSGGSAEEETGEESHGDDAGAMVQGISSHG
jgi:hypothetical protein